MASTISRVPYPLGFRDPRILSQGVNDFWSEHSIANLHPDSLCRSPRLTSAPPTLHHSLSNILGILSSLINKRGYRGTSPLRNSAPMGVLFLMSEVPPYAMVAKAMSDRATRVERASLVSHAWRAARRARLWRPCLAGLKCLGWGDRAGLWWHTTPGGQPDIATRGGTVY